jgi:D-3-phosphoglycerate dehydrogenase / 2-oxoglutarate reductase
VAGEPESRDRPTILVAYPPERRPRLYPDWALERLRALGDVRELRASVDAGELAWLAEADGIDVVISDRLVAAPAEAFARLPRLRAFVRGAMDIRTVDVTAASRHGVLVVRGTPGWVDAVCELILGLAVSLLRHVPEAVAAYRSGEPPPIRTGRQLSGSSLGVIGYGNLGRRMVELGRALHMTVLVSDPFAHDLPAEVPNLTLHDLLAQSDVVVCLAAHTSDTENLLDEAAIRAMRADAILVNASRGGLVDEDALYRALVEHRIAGAALDVGRERDDLPPPRIARLPNVVATPHVGGNVPEAIAHHAEETVRQTEAILSRREPEGAQNWRAAYRVHGERAATDGGSPEDPPATGGEAGGAS